MPDVKTSGIFYLLAILPAKIIWLNYMTKLHAIKSYFAFVYNKNYSQGQLPLLASMSIVSTPTFGLTLLEGINNGSSYE